MTICFINSLSLQEVSKLGYSSSFGEDEEKQVNCKLRLTSPHGCNMIWDFYRVDGGEPKSCESQPTFKHHCLGWRKLFSVWSVQGTPGVQPYKCW